LSLWTHLPKTFSLLRREFALAKIIAATTATR
jgi:hypothetical protein